MGEPNDPPSLHTSVLAPFIQIVLFFFESSTTLGHGLRLFFGRRTQKAHWRWVALAGLGSRGVRQSADNGKVIAHIFCLILMFIILTLGDMLRDTRPGPCQ